MRQGSLRLRLLAAGAASVIIALAIAGLGLLLLFERHVERRMTVELDTQLRQVLSGLERGDDGALQLVRPLAEPRFQVPLSGLYWQVMVEPDGPVLRSRSLWDTELRLPPDQPADPDIHQHTIAGPGRSSLLAIERTVTLPASLGGDRVRAVVALDRSDIHAAGRAFASDLAPSLAVLAAVLVAAAWVQVAVGLRPLDAVRRRLAAIRAGHAPRLGAAFPDEVGPLAAEVDHLLDAQEEAIARARARAADLAHGLKTPLTVLAGTAEALRARGETRLADEIAAVTDGMRRHVERELARSRASILARPRAAEPILPVVAQVVTVLRKTPQGGGLAWQIAVPADLRAGVDRQDMTEMVGNLLENAAKWAKSQVRVSAGAEDGGVALAVEDDGPGIPDDQVPTVLARGGRLDETQPGTGLGLAIVSDLLEAHGGALVLARSSLGGLLARITLPARTAA